LRQMFKASYSATDFYLLNISNKSKIAYFIIIILFQRILFFLKYYLNS